MQSRTLPRGSPLRRALDTIADDHPDNAEEVIRRRLIAIIAHSGIAITQVAARIGQNHSLLVRRLAPPDAPAADRRPLDDDTILQVFTALDIEPTRLLTIEHDLGDVDVLRWLIEAVGAKRAEGVSRYVAAKLTLPIEAARLNWADADARIARLSALGFITETGGRLSATRSGWACAAR